jgi:Gpi18-like mannosyltransferase
MFSTMWGLISIGSLFVSAYFFYKIVEHLWGEEKGIILGTATFSCSSPCLMVYRHRSVTIAGLLGAIYFCFSGHRKLGGAILGVTATFKPIGLVILPVLLKSEFLSWRAG